jgi:hypothetical protein
MGQSEMPQRTSVEVSAADWGLRRGGLNHGPEGPCYGEHDAQAQ